jgi:hypothetical protein
VKDGKLEELKIADRYHSRADYLHGHCFYLGLCEPKEPIERRIRETEDYIKDLERLVGARQTTF